MRRKQVDEQFIKDCVAEALDQLMRDHSYQEIRVTDLCRRAGVGRTSFYRYFSGQDALYSALLYKIGRTWRSFSERNAGSAEKDPDLAFLEYIYEERELFQWLFKNQQYGAIFDIFYSTTVQDQRSETPETYHQAFLAGGIFGVLYQWAKNDFSIPPDQIYQMTRPGQTQEP